MVIQFAAVLFLTPEGLSAVFPLAVSYNGETVVPDFVFDEYYDLKSEFEGCDTFFIGADTTVADSYTAILDLFRFLNRYFDVRTLGLNVGKATASRVNDCLAAKSADELEEKIAALRASGIFSGEFISFARALAAFASTRPLGKELQVRSVNSDTVRRATLDKVHSELIARWGSADKELTDALSINDVDVFFEHFYAHEEMYREFLGDEDFARFVEIDEHRVAGDYNEWHIASQMEEFVSSPSLTVVDRTVISQDSPLRAYVGAMGAKSAFVGVEYVSCRGVFKGEEIDVHDFSQPLAPSRGLYFVSETSMSSFVSYCRFIDDPSGGSSVSPTHAPDYYVVVGSPAVKYGEDDR